MLELLMERSGARLECEEELWTNWLGFRGHNWTLSPSQLPGTVRA
jgi:hypothetical protein